MSSFIEEYFNTQRNAEIIHGDKAVVLAKVGCFYEIYQDPTSDLGKAREISKLLNLRLILKNGNKESSSENPYMMGIPCTIFDFYETLLHHNGYAITIMDK